MEKVKDQDQMQMAILNFQAMTETSDQELAARYLASNHWDESVASLHNTQ